jgi:hypothetical protein
MDVVWRVSADRFDAEAFITRHRLNPCVRHGGASFNVVIAEGIESSPLDSLVEAFLREHRIALQELASVGAPSELDLAYFIHLGEELGSGVCVSPSVLSALGDAGVGLAVTTYLCQDE